MGAHIQSDINEFLGGSQCLIINFNQEWEKLEIIQLSHRIKFDDIICTCRFIKHEAKQTRQEVIHHAIDNNLQIQQHKPKAPVWDPIAQGQNTFNLRMQKWRFTEVMAVHAKWV